MSLWSHVLIVLAALVAVPMLFLATDGLLGWLVQGPGPFSPVSPDKHEPAA